MEAEIIVVQYHYFLKYGISFGKLACTLLSVKLSSTYRRNRGYILAICGVFANKPDSCRLCRSNLYLTQYFQSPDSKWTHQTNG